MKVAIFDFDGTLYPHETFPLLMKHLKTHPVHYKKYRYFFSKVFPVYIAYKCKVYPEQKMREFTMWNYIASFRSESSDELELFFSEIGNMMYQSLRESLLERLDQHRKDGYYIMLVSGAYEQLLPLVMQDIQFDSIIGTRVLKSEGKFPLDYIHGVRKKEVIEEQLGENQVDWKNSYAYGDSYSDLNVLELVGNPVAVKPDAALLQVANNRKWEIID